MMKSHIPILTLLVFLTGCVVEYIPGIRENDEILVIEGLLTDQPERDTIKIYRTLPIWTRDFRKPIRHCDVWITDDMGNAYTLTEAEVGIYVTDPSEFIGIPGRTYRLHITTTESDGVHRYESIPMKMKPVPEIDSLYYEKRTSIISTFPAEGCQIYLDTHDPSGSCRFYRWEYEETWEFSLPFDVPNKTCWGQDKSDNEIMLKNTSLLTEDVVSRYPVKLIVNPVERLVSKYSILVRQYSLNEDEYRFWEKLKNSISQVGGMYDIIPETITGNVYSLDDRLEKVAGYFSVSSVRSERLFIKDKFIYHTRMYSDCAVDSAYYLYVPALGGYMWVRYDYTIPFPYIDLINQEQWGVTWWYLYDYTDSIPPKRILTNKRWCGDCTAKGTYIRPPFWDTDN